MWPFDWLFGDSDDEPYSYVDYGDGHDEDEEYEPLETISEDEFEDIELGGFHQEKKINKWIQQENMHLDEAPVTVAELTDHVEYSDDNPYLTRYFAPIHYGGILWGRVYVFETEWMEEGPYPAIRWTLVETSADGRPVLGKRWRDVDPMEYLDE